VRRQRCPSQHPRANLNPHGTPFSSHSLNLKPGVRWSRSSSLNRSRPFHAAVICSTAVITAVRARIVIDRYYHHLDRRKARWDHQPSSSECAMIRAPIRRVLMPQLVVQAYWIVLVWSEKVMLNALAKF